VEDVIIKLKFGILIIINYSILNL